MSSFSLKTVKHMKNGEAGFELLINPLEFMFYIQSTLGLETTLRQRGRGF